MVIGGHTEIPVGGYFMQAESQALKILPFAQLIAC